MSEGDGRADEDGREIARLERKLRCVQDELAGTRIARDSTLKTLSDSVAKRASCELALIETAKVRDEWCAEFVKARNALKAIFDATDPYADGVVDAGAHAHLALEISSIARPWKDAQP